MLEECTLDKLPLNAKAAVKEVKCREELKNRLFDLGIFENSVITPVLRAPFGGTSAYSVKNAVIALRNRDCEKITVIPL